MQHYLVSDKKSASHMHRLDKEVGDYQFTTSEQGLDKAGD